MCFSAHKKRIFIVAFVVGALLVQTACDRFLKGPTKDASNSDNGDTVVISLDEVSCLKKAPEKLQNFFDDEGDPKSLEAGIGCIQSSLKTFMKYTRGSQLDSYSGKELQYFFNKYLLKGSQISDDFQKEIIKLKVIAVGGTTELVTRAELNLFIQFLDVIKSEGAKLQGKMRLLFFRQDSSQVDYEQIQSLQKIAQEVAAHILAKSKVAESRYQWVDLVSFMNELNRFVGESKSLAAVLKWVPLAESVKLLFIGENAKILTQREWDYSARWVVDAYSVMLKFYYQIRSREFSAPVQWTTLIRWLDEVMVGIETSPEMKEKKILDAKAIDRLAEEIYKLKLFNTVLSVDMVKTCYREVLAHLIEGLPGGQGSAANIMGITEGHFHIIKQEYNVWKLSQTFINRLYQNNSNVTNRLMVSEALKVTPVERAKSLTEDPLNQKELVRSWSDFLALINSNRPIVYNATDKVVIGYNPQTVAFSFTGANLMNFVYLMTRLTLRGYGEHKSVDLFDNRISEAGLIQFEEDFRDVGQKIGFLDPRSPIAAKRAFKEANFFTFHGNGDDWMSPVETFEELNLMISGGRIQIDQVMVDLEKRNCLTNDLDVFGKKIVKEACFVQAFRENLKDYLDNMVWMRNFISGLSSNDFAVFYQNIMALSELDPQYRVSGRIEYTEIRTMLTILHYVESLMVLYDKDFNQKLNEQELISAVPRFDRFIEDVSPLGDYFVEDIFLYLVYKGQKPTGVSDLILFKIERAAGLGEVDQLSLVKVLGVLKKDAR